MDPAVRSLQELLHDRLFADESLTGPARELILAAYAGAAEFEAELSGGSGSGNQGANRTEHAANRPPEPPGTYLRGIAVEGFRGISGRQRLELAPGPGLTVITGRNGSGKSSFAEATETALTGHNERWRGRSPEWAKGFRNVHHDGPVRIEVELAEGNAPGPRTITRTWEGTDFTASAACTQYDGSPRRGYDPREWGELLETYRPFLPYTELGKVLSGRPSDLHDGVLALLGMERLTAAQQRIAEQDAAGNKAARELDEERENLRAACAMAEDDRARRCARLLAGRDPDLAALADLALGSDDDDAHRSALHAVVGLRAPDAQRVQTAAERLLTAATEVDRLRTAEADAARSAAQLLRGGIEHHRQFGDGPCPVCWEGRLNGDWVQEAERSALEHEELAGALRAAEQNQLAAYQQARELVPPVPAALESADLGLPVKSVLVAWQRFTACGSLPEPELAFELLARRDDLAVALGSLRTAAESELARTNEIWGPLAHRLRAWHDRADEFRRGDPQRKAITAAKQWLKRATDELRNERLRPFAAQSQEIWNGLRQTSNIGLDGLRLTGTGNQRRLRLDVNVDGQGSGALSVMSQGELHALGLALFLPRATTAESPFRFVVIDDPVQAMDPAKVDGLAQVLSAVAEHRQVLVFTHDDRLTEAVRRLRLPATVLEICRRERSEVQVREVQDPVTRYLDDARALTKDAGLPSDLRSELVVGLCRSALEAAAHAKVRERRLGRGERHEEVEDLLARAHTTHRRLTIAVLDDPNRERDLFQRLQAADRNAVDTLKTCKSGAHNGFSGDLRALVSDVHRLANWVVGLR